MLATIHFTFSSRERTSWGHPVPVPGKNNAIKLIVRKVFDYYAFACKNNYILYRIEKRAHEINRCKGEKDLIQCLSPAKKYKLYKSYINKSIHFVQRSLSSSTRGKRVTAQLNLSREWKNRMTTVVISAILNPVSRVSTPH